MAAVHLHCSNPTIAFTTARSLPSRTSLHSRARHRHLPFHVHLPSSFSTRRSFVVHAQHDIAPLKALQQAFLQVPPSWASSLIVNATIFTIGFPILQTGLTSSGIAAAYLLGTLTWRAFGAPAFLLVVAYFVVGTAVTKVKIKQKEKEGIAEKRSGKRGPSSVWGSGAAGIACSVAAIAGLGGPLSFQLWQLGFVASFATKLSDTVSSEIGKAFGKTTYLVTTLKPVQRGTEGAISLEGTLAGVTASLFLSLLARQVHQITGRGVVICIAASQVANFIESYVGATVQGKQGLEWLNNDVVNVLNISIGTVLAMFFYSMAAI